ncbi:hypothetical protein Bca4012_042744 [Brassica carinata]
MAHSELFQSPIVSLSWIWKESVEKRRVEGAWYPFFISLLSLLVSLSVSYCAFVSKIVTWQSMAFGPGVVSFNRRLWFSGVVLYNSPASV